MRLSPSQVDKFRECPEAWHYSYIEKLKPIGGGRRWEKGTFSHELLHVLYQTHKANPQLKFGSEQAQNFMRHRITNTEVTSDNVKLMATVLPLITRYVSEQSRNIDSGIEILGVELEFKIPFGDVLLHGFIDLVYRDNQGRIWIRDHKTSEQINAWNMDKLRMAGQLLFYCLAMSIYLNEPVHNVEINFLNTYPYVKPEPASKLFKLFRFSHQESSVSAFADNLVQYHSFMESDPRLMAFDARKCPGCIYHDLCYLSGRGMNIDDLKKSNFEQVAEPDKPINLLDRSTSLV